MAETRLVRDQAEVHVNSKKVDELRPLRPNRKWSILIDGHFNDGHSKWPIVSNLGRFALKIGRFESRWAIFDRILKLYAKSDSFLVRNGRRRHYGVFCRKRRSG